MWSALSGMGDSPSNRGDEGLGCGDCDCPRPGVGTGVGTGVAEAFTGVAGIALLEDAMGGV